MKIKFYIRKEANKKDFESKTEIYVRLYHGVDVDQKEKTQLTINPNYWDAKRESAKTVGVNEAIWKPINEELRKLRSFLESQYLERRGKQFKPDWLKNILYTYYCPVNETIKEYTFFDVFDYFLTVHEISDVRRKNYKVLERSLQRFELYKRLGKNKNYTLHLKDITADTIREFKDFFRDEYLHFEKYPSLFLSVPESRKPYKRGKNTLIDRFNRLHAFFEWCLQNGYIDKQPFDNVEIGSCNYGRPIYITKEERDIIMNYDLSLRPLLAVQRDIFIFQSLIGCRVSDLYRFTWDNIQDGVLSYIPHKTKDGNARTARVPLNTQAQRILEMYKDENRKTLFPFISVQKYNDDIKTIFEVCGITRTVTILDPKTGEETQTQINKIASSHMARRTFCGILYKKTKDPNIIGTMSGHAPGSKAFARYRDIDDDILKETVSYLD